MTAILANAHRGENHPGFEPGDFFPSLAAGPEELDDDALWAKFDNWAMAHNASLAAKKG